MKGQFICNLPGCDHRSFKSVHALHVHQATNGIHLKSNGLVSRKDQAWDAQSELVVLRKIVELLNTLSSEGMRWVQGKIGSKSS